MSMIIEEAPGTRCYGGPGQSCVFSITSSADSNGFRGFMKHPDMADDTHRSNEHAFLIYNDDGSGQWEPHMTNVNVSDGRTENDSKNFTLKDTVAGSSPSALFLKYRQPWDSKASLITAINPRPVDASQATYTRCLPDLDTQWRHFEADRVFITPFKVEDLESVMCELPRSSGGETSFRGSSETLVTLSEGPV